MDGLEDPKDEKKEKEMPSNDGLDKTKEEKEMPSMDGLDKNDEESTTEPILTKPLPKASKKLKSKGGSSKQKKGSLL